MPLRDARRRARVAEHADASAGLQGGGQRGS